MKLYQKMLIEIVVYLGSTDVCNLLQPGKLGLTHLGWECILKAESVTG